jgi:hypothetical protein
MIRMISENGVRKGDQAPAAEVAGEAREATRLDQGGVAALERSDCTER